jgi:hypothetical protein
LIEGGDGSSFFHKSRFDSFFVKSAQTAFCHNLEQFRFSGKKSVASLEKKLFTLVINSFVFKTVR